MKLSVFFVCSLSKVVRHFSRLFFLLRFTMSGEIRLPSLDDVSFNVDTSKLMHTLKEIVKGVQAQSTVLQNIKTFVSIYLLISILWFRFVQRITASEKAALVQTQTIQALTTRIATLEGELTKRDDTMFKVQRVAEKIEGRLEAIEQVSHSSYSPQSSYL
jgi:hypothetical protein